MIRVGRLLACLMALTLVSPTRVWSQNTLPEREKLLVQMQRAQKAESKSIERRYRKALRDLVGNQEREYKEWVDFERKSRRDFFEQHLKGPERRDYIQGYFERKKQMEEGQKTERDLKRLEITRQRQQALDQLDRNSAIYKEKLLRGETPPVDLLPGAKKSGNDAKSDDAQR